MKLAIPKSWLISLIAISFAGPFKLVALAQMPIFAVWILARGRVNPIVAALLGVVLVAHLSLALFSVPDRSFALLLSLLFLLPLMTAALIDRFKANITRETLVASLSIFLWFQVALSIANIVFFLAFGDRGSLDVNFGDVVAGSMRVPLVYFEDSSNKAFVFLMLSLTALYLSIVPKTHLDYRLLVGVAAVSFLASVNHLVLLAFAAWLLASGIGIRHVLAIVIAAGVLIVGYVYVQPTNAMLMYERFSAIASDLSPSGLAHVSDKLAYFFVTITLFADHLPLIVSIGLGPAEYATRAAHFAAGTLQQDVPVQYQSAYFREITGPLFDAFTAKPQYLKGAFYFPYDGLLSFIAEYGAPLAAAVFFSIYRLCRKVDRKFAVFAISFIALASLVDHYLEYYRALSVFFLFTILAGAIVDQENQNRAAANRLVLSPRRGSLWIRQNI